MTPRVTYVSDGVKCLTMCAFVWIIDVKTFLRFLFRALFNGFNVFFYFSNFFIFKNVH